MHAAAVQASVATLVCKYRLGVQQRKRRATARAHACMHVCMPGCTRHHAALMRADGLVQWHATPMRAEPADARYSSAVKGWHALIDSRKNAHLRVFHRGTQKHKKYCPAVGPMRHPNTKPLPPHASHACRHIIHPSMHSFIRQSVDLSV
eukprot:364987-Chlamydomonas_euryale.AAC.5